MCVCVGLSIKHTLSNVFVVCFNRHLFPPSPPFDGGITQDKHASFNICILKLKCSSVSAHSAASQTQSQEVLTGVCVCV